MSARPETAAALTPAEVVGWHVAAARESRRQSKGFAIGGSSLPVLGVPAALAAGGLASPVALPSVDLRSVQQTAAALFREVDAAALGLVAIGVGLALLLAVQCAVEFTIRRRGRHDVDGQDHTTTALAGRLVSATAPASTDATIRGEQ